MSEVTIRMTSNAMGYRSGAEVTVERSAFVDALLNAKRAVVVGEKVPADPSAAAQIAAVRILEAERQAEVVPIVPAEDGDADQPEPVAEQAEPVAVVVNADLLDTTFGGKRKRGS